MRFLSKDHIHAAKVNKASKRAASAFESWIDCPRLSEAKADWCNLRSALVSYSSAIGLKLDDDGVLKAVQLMCAKRESEPHAFGQHPSNFEDKLNDRVTHMLLGSLMALGSALSYIQAGAELFGKILSGGLMLASAALIIAGAGWLALNNYHISQNARNRRVRLQDTLNEIVIPLACGGTYEPSMDSATSERTARRFLRRAKKDGVGKEGYTYVLDEAILNKTLPSLFFDRLVSARGWSDDLPYHENANERLQMTYDHPAYPDLKCKAHTIVSITARLQACAEECLIKDPKVMAAIYNFKHYDWNAFRGSKGEYWTTREEIDLMNRTLDTVIDYLKKEYHLP